MKTRLIFALLLGLLSFQPVQSQGIFDAIKSGWEDFDNEFTGNKDKAAAAKIKADQQKAAEKLKAEQAKAQEEQDKAVAERIAVHDLDQNGENQLMRAIRAGDAEVSKDLIKRGANARLTNYRGVSTMHEAVKSEDPAIVELIILNGGNLNAVDQTGKTPMDVAMQFPNNEVVQKLVTNNAPITINHIDRAIQLEQDQVLETLLVNGGNPEYALAVALKRKRNQLFQDIMTKYSVAIDNSVFNFAVDERNFEAAEILLSSNVNPDQALDYAISKNAKQLIEPTLSAGANGNKALGYAIEKRDQTLAETCIMMFNADPNPHLATAINKNNVPMMDMLLMNGADANMGLSAAVAKNNVMIVKKLLDNGADANTQIATVSAAGNDQMVKALLESGADANKGGMAAAKAGKFNTAKILVEAGADANPILPIAVTGKNLPLVKTCLESGADANTGIEIAVNAGDDKIAIVLLDAGADASPAAYIKKACELKKNQLVAKLLEKGADANNGMETSVNAANIQLITMLLGAGADATPAKFIEKACELKNGEMVGKLLEAGADANNGMVMCIEKNDEAILAQLLAKGADGTSPTFIKKACTTGNVSIVKQLIAVGADATATDLLKPAVKHNNVALTGLLFENGADSQQALQPAVEANASTVVEQIGNGGVDLTAAALLNTAVSRKFSATAGVLLKAGSDPNLPTVTGSGYKMIHIAAENIDLSMANILIQYKAEVNVAASSNGNSPLHLLAMQKKPGKNGQALAEALIMAGADVNARNGKDELVFQVCRAGKVKGVLKKNKALRK